MSDLAKLISACELVVEKRMAVIERRLLDRIQALEERPMHYERDEREMPSSGMEDMPGAVSAEYMKTLPGSKTLVDPEGPCILAGVVKIHPGEWVGLDRAAFRKLLSEKMQDTGDRMMRCWEEEDLRVRER